MLRQLSLLTGSGAAVVICDQFSPETGQCTLWRCYGMKHSIVCDNTMCCNPRHVLVGTDQRNFFFWENGKRRCKRMAPQVGLEPTTLRLTVARTEVLPSTDNRDCLWKITGCRLSSGS